MQGIFYYASGGTCKFDGENYYKDDGSVYTEPYETHDGLGVMSLYNGELWLWDGSDFHLW